MGNDYLKKEPSKTEKALYEIAMRVEMQDRSLHSNSGHIIALSIALDLDPKKVAEILLDDQAIRDYAKKINDAIKEIEDKKKPVADPAPTSDDSEVGAPTASVGEQPKVE